MPECENRPGKNGQRATPSNVQEVGKESRVDEPSVTGMALFSRSGIFNWGRSMPPAQPVTKQLMSGEACKAHGRPGCC